MINVLIAALVILGLVGVVAGLLMWIGVAIMHMDSINDDLLMDGEHYERKASSK